MALFIDRIDVESVTVTFKNGDSMVITDPPKAYVKGRSKFQDHKPTKIEWEVRWTEE